MKAVTRPSASVCTTPNWFDSSSGALLRRKDVNIFAQLRAEKTPAIVDVAVQAARFELGEHQNFAQPAVDAVGESEVDDPVIAAEGHGRFGAVARERLEACPLAAGQDQGEHFLHKPNLRRAVRGEMPTGCHTTMKEASKFEAVKSAAFGPYFFGSTPMKGKWRYSSL